jgi:hypothetical protein
MIFSRAMIDPGHPWVTMTGKAFAFFERTGMPLPWIFDPHREMDKWFRNSVRIRNAPGILSSSVARIAAFTLASCPG